MRLEMYGHNIGLSEAARVHIASRVEFALGRFGARINRVRILLADLNGPRGGIDKRCRMIAELLRAGPVVVEHRAAGWGAAVAGAAGRLGHAVRRRLTLRCRGRRPGSWPGSRSFPTEEV
jgi:hypothetical protein